MNLPVVRIKIITAFLIASGIILFNSCDAPRENPLDPNSSDNLLGTLEGTVQTFSLPYTPIKDVEVLWKPGNILVYTDASGNFTIPNIKRENGLLIIRKEGYHEDTLQVDWAGKQKVSEQINLNKIPELDSLLIYSRLTNTLNPPSTLSEIVIQTKISDVDNDIDTVFVVNDDLGLVKAMDFDIGSKTFQVILSLQDLNITDLEQAVGLEFDFRIRDILGEVYPLKGSSVKRVIKDQVTGLQPSNDQIITVLPLKLSWNSYMAGFSFHYNIEIFTNEGGQLVQSINDISSDSTYTTIDTLDSGNYWWRIWVVDQFNDINKSLPATFSVQ